jgi:hypothetical protein
MFTLSPSSSSRRLIRAEFILTLNVAVVLIQRVGQHLGAPGATPVLETPNPRAQASRRWKSLLRPRGATARPRHSR